MISSVFIAPNSLGVEVPITPSSGNTVASYIFPTQQELQNRKIIAIEAFCALDVTYSPLTPSQGVLPVNLFKGAFLSLYTSNPTQIAANAHQEPGLFYDKVPLVMFRRMRNDDTAETPLASYSGDLFRIRPTELAFNKCKVEFPTPISIGTTYSAFFVFHYLDVGDPGDKYFQQ